MGDLLCIAFEALQYEGIFQSYCQNERILLNKHQHIINEPIFAYDDKNYAGFCLTCINLFATCWLLWKYEVYSNFVCQVKNKWAYEGVMNLA